jgi:hypothetical protein
MISQEEINQALLVIFTLLQVWDVHTTQDALKRGYGVEANPVLGSINHMTPAKRFWLLLVLKVAVCAFLWWQFDASVAAAWVYGALVIFYGYVVAWSNTKLWYVFHFGRNNGT